MTPEQELEMSQHHSKTQNALSDLADDKFKSILVSVIKEDSTIDTFSYGNLEDLTFLNTINTTMINGAVANMFNGSNK